MERYGVFLDRDGTIIEDLDYLSEPDDVMLIPGAADAIRSLSERGYRIIMVSNQSGVARGMFPEEAVDRVNQRLRELLEAKGAYIDAAYYCPHHPQGKVPQYRRRCDCRKPAPGMGLRAAKEWGLLLSGSYMIGDKLEDIRFGENCGMKNAFLVSTGHGTEYALPGGYGAAARDICQAADLILKNG